MDLEIADLVRWHATALTLRDEADARLAEATAVTIAALFRKR